MKINILKFNSFVLTLSFNLFIIDVFLKKLGIDIKTSFLFLPLYFLTFFLNCLNDIYKKKKYTLKIFLIFIYLFIILINLLFYFYEEIFNLNLKFFLYIVINIYLSTIKISLKFLKKYLAILNIFSLLILIYVQVNKELYEVMNLDYMVFGYSCLLCSLIFSYFYKEIMGFKFLILVIFTNIINLIYGSRFTFLLGIIGSTMFLYSSKNKFIKKGIRVFLLISPLLYFNLKRILGTLALVLKKINLPLYSIERLINSVGTSGSVLSGRELWYSETLKIIQENLFLGSGILGYYNKISKSLYNFDGSFYPHNIFLEILLNFGIIGISVFFLIIFFVIKKIMNNRKKGLYLDNIEIIFFIMSLGLLFSGSYIRNYWFYLTLLIPFTKSYYRVQSEREMIKY